MRVDELRTALTKRPFQSFLVHLADGRAIRVEHPDFALLSPGGRTLIVYQRDESCNMIDVMLITDLEVGPPPPTAQAS
jgi:hypothetical protein